jgi:osmotically-inducible protein OsmY
MMRTRLGILLALVVLPLVEGCIPLAITGAGTAALMATDRRSTGTYVDDEGIELKALARLHEFSAAHVSATSFNRRVLLTGQVPESQVRKRIQESVRTIPNVREVVDETEVAGASSLASRGNDALITSNVKARMVNNNRFSPNHVKVVTEAGVVYLMGLVTREEADAAVDVARTTSGVSRVVKEFEYLG